MPAPKRVNPLLSGSLPVAARPNQQMPVEVQGVVWQNSGHSSPKGLISDYAKPITAASGGWLMIRGEGPQLGHQQCLAATRQMGVAISMCDCHVVLGIEKDNGHHRRQIELICLVAACIGITVATCEINRLGHATPCYGPGIGICQDAQKRNF